MTATPAQSNGRGTGGRFTVGNPGGPGNPHNAKVAQFRAVLFEAVSERDLRAIVAKLVKQAKAGDIDAAKVVLDRLLGKPKQDINIQQETTLDPNDAANMIAGFLANTRTHLGGADHASGLPPSS